MVAVKLGTGVGVDAEVGISVGNGSGVGEYVDVHPSRISNKKSIPAGRRRKRTTVCLLIIIFFTGLRVAHCCGVGVHLINVYSIL